MNNKIANVVFPLCMCCITALLVIALVEKVAAADSNGGLYAEQEMKADDVIVRRIRDTSNGAVCYVASSSLYPVHGNPSRSVSISCLPKVP